MAKGDGATDDRAAVQAAIDACYAAGGGIVFFPAGDYLIGTPGLVMPSNSQVAIMLMGAGMGASGTGNAGTQLKRNGAYTLLSASGTGATGATVNNGLTVRDISLFCTLTFNAALVRLDRCAHVNFENVRMADSGSYALQATQLWNSNFYRCNFETSGSLSGTIPAVLLADSASSNTDTVSFMACIFEQNSYTDIVLDGSGGRTCGPVKLVGCKHERGGGVGVHVKQAQFTSITGCQISTSSALPCVKVDANSLLTSVTGSTLVAGTGSPSYLLQATGAGQNLTVTGNGFQGGTTAHIRIESTFGGVQTKGNDHFLLSGEIPIQDARTGLPVNSDAPAAQAFHNANQSIASGASTVLAFNSERFDTDIIHDTVTNNSRLTCKTPGLYMITVTADWGANPGSGGELDIKLNGTTFIGVQSFANVTGMSTAILYPLVAGDYVEAFVFQNSGGAVNIVAVGNYSPNFTMVKVA